MIRLKYPLISVVIVTLNSERTLDKTLLSIRKQNYPQDKIEILVIDGGSIDNTMIIAKKYGCKIMEIPKTEISYRKQRGFIEAKGKYLIYLDSDESLDNPQSLKLKYTVLLNNHLVKSVISEGAKSPEHSSFINNYINEFGDPFSFYVYREAKSNKYIIKTWKKKYKVIKEDSNYVIFDLVNSSRSSLIELWAGGCMIDLKYTKSIFPSINQDPSLVAHLFYLLKNNGKLLAITKNDYIIHDSSASLIKYLKKISSRVKNNIFQTEMGLGGYLGREQFQNRSYYFKKFLFPFYAFSLFLPFLDAVSMSISNKNISYLIHFPLSIYTAIIIIYFMILKLMGVRPQLLAYGT